MTALVNAPNDSVCPECTEAVTGVSLKCGTTNGSGCTKYLHLKCTGLPLHYLIRFGATRASYLCKGCIETEAGDEYEAIKIKVLAEIGTEEVQEVEDPSLDNAVVQNGVTVSSQTEEPAGTPISTGAGHSSGDRRANHPGGQMRNRINERDICCDYLLKKCRFGKSGKVGGTCPHKHPRLCYRFLKFGNGNNGCTRGKDCSFHHPRICWQYSRGRDCPRENCTFYHARRQKPSNRRSEPAQRDVAPRNVLNGANREPLREDRRSYPNQPRTLPDRPGRSYDEETHMSQFNRNFLELQRQMDQLMKMMISEKQRGPPQQNSCQCGRQY